MLLIPLWCWLWCVCFRVCVNVNDSAERCGIVEHKLDGIHSHIFPLFVFPLLSFTVYFVIPLLVVLPLLILFCKPFANCHIFVFRFSTDMHKVAKAPREIGGRWQRTWRQESSSRNTDTGSGGQQDIEPSTLANKKTAKAQGNSPLWTKGQAPTEWHRQREQVLR